MLASNVSTKVAVIGLCWLKHPYVLPYVLLSMTHSHAMAARSSYHDAFQWISEQPESFIDRLYGERTSTLIKSDDKSTDMMDERKISIQVRDEAVFACRAVFQSLKALSKSYVLRLIMLETVHIDEMSAWTRDSGHHATTVNELRKYRIIIPQTNETIIDNSLQSKMFSVNQYFKENFIYGLTFPSEPWSNISQRLNIPITYSNHDIESAAIEKWNNILKYLMNVVASLPDQSMSSITEFMRKHMGLITEKRTLTSNGYEFMLKDYHTQIWEVIWRITEYFPNHEESLTLLFMLSYCQPHRAYPVASLSKIQKQLLQACHEIGIIYISPKEKDRASLFYPTRAAVNLIFKFDAHRSNREVNSDDMMNHTAEPVSFVKLNELRIIVETNMQVVAYICSDLHVSLLNLFVDVNVRLPNVVIGRITREKAKQAFNVGITVAQMVDFLSSHSHDVVKAKHEGSRLPVPDNVVDQLVLWQAEDHRTSEIDAEVIVFDPSQVTMAMFHEYVSYLKRLNACLWSDESSFQIAVTVAGYESLVSLIGDQGNGDYY